MNTEIILYSLKKYLLQIDRSRSIKIRRVAISPNPAMNIRTGTIFGWRNPSSGIKITKGDLVKMPIQTENYLDCLAKLHDAGYIYDNNVQFCGIPHLEHQKLTWVIDLIDFINK